MDAEVWKDIPGYEWRYWASNYWRLKSKRKILKSSCNKKYQRVRISDSKNIFKTYLVHRLILISFTENCELEVNHKDWNKSNNLLSNLEWSTHKDNQIHASFHLNKWNWIKRPYISNMLSKPVLQYSIDNKYIQTFESMTIAAQSTWAKQQSISACCQNKYWYNTAAWYIWKYK